MKPISVRTLKVDQADIQAFIDPELEVAVDGDYVYLVTDLFGDSWGYFRWPREMELTAPNKLETQFLGIPDFRNVVHARFWRYVDGLSNCVLRLFLGRLLPEKRNGYPVFEIQPAETAEQVLTMALWPESLSPAYDNRPEGLFVRELSLQLIERHKPNERSYASEGCGYDLWLIPRGKLGRPFDEALSLQEELRRSTIQNEWQLYEQRREFYRKRIEQIPDLDYVFGFTGLCLNRGEDHFQITKADSEAARAVFGKGEKPFYQFWYDDYGLEFLEELRERLHPIAQTVEAMGGIDALYRMNASVATGPSSGSIAIGCDASNLDAIFQILGGGLFGGI